MLRGLLIVAPVESLEGRLLLAAGDLDPSFGQGGFGVFADNGPVLAMALAPGGKIVVAEPHGVIACFNPDGSRDMTFGPNHAGETNVYFDIAGIAVDSAGRIVAGGGDSAAPGTQSQWYLSRLNPDGSFDSTFNGISTFDQSANSEQFVPVTTLVGTRGKAGWFALQPDGKVLLGGSFAGGETNDPAGNPSGTVGSNIDLVRYNADGTPDTTFGQNGETLTSNGDWNSEFIHNKELFVRPNGQIVVIGAVNPAIEFVAGYQVVFDDSGHSLSSGFNGPGGYIDSISDAMLPDGTVVSATDEAFAQNVLDFDGRQVPFEFNTLLLDAANPATGTAGDIAAAIATHDSKLLVAADGAVARFNTDGSPDRTFGFGGTSTFSLDPYHDGWTTPQTVSALAETSAGDIIVAGTLRGKVFLAKIEGGAHTVGQDPPRVSAAVVYPDPIDNQPLSLNVRFFGENPIDVSTIEAEDIVVTGPNGYSAVGKFGVQGIGTIDESPLDVPIDIPDPGTSAAAAGVYTVHLSGHVADILGHQAASGIIGTFSLPHDLSSTPAPADAPFVADILSPYGPAASERTMTFQARFHSPVGIDLSTLNDSNFIVRHSDGISTAARFVSAKTSEDGATAIATYQISAPGGQNWDDPVVESVYYTHPAQGQYSIEMDQSPLDNAGHGAAGPNIYQGPFGNFTNDNGSTAQPAATLEGVDPPVDGQPVQFEIRYTVAAGATMNLSSLQDSAVSVDPLNALPSFYPGWAHLDRADVVQDGSVIATYSMSQSQVTGLYGIRSAIPQPSFATATGPRDDNDVEVPGGLLGTIDLDYAYRRPSVTLLSAQATPSPRRYASFQVRYDSLSGINQAMLDNSDLLVTAPDGTAVRTRLSSVVDNINANGTVVSYFFRVPVGASGAYSVTMAARQVRDLFGRRVSGGVMGTIDVLAAGVQRRLETVPLMTVQSIGANLKNAGMFASSAAAVGDNGVAADSGGSGRSMVAQSKDWEL